MDNNVITLFIIKRFDDYRVKQPGHTLCYTVSVLVRLKKNNKKIGGGLEERKTRDLTM